MQEMNDKTPDGSDSETDIPINCFSPHDAKDFTVGKIVWVSYGKSFWPALVRRLYPREKKAMIVFVDQPVNEKGQENKLKVSYNRIMRFNCTRKNEFLNVTGQPKRKAAIDLAESYMLKTCDKSLYVSPIEYFKNPMSNLLRKLQLESGDVEEDPQPSEDLPTVSEEPSSQEVVELGDSGESDEDEEGTNEIRTVQNTEEENEDDELVARIITIIKSDNCRKHLIGIKNKETECRREYLYSNPTRINRARLEYPLFGPIKNFTQRWDVLNYLISIVSSMNFSDNSATKFNYVMKVWLAEAINFALMEIFNLDYAAADRKLSLTNARKVCAEKP